MKSKGEINLARSPAQLKKSLELLIGCKYFETMTADNLRQVLKKSTYLEVPAGTKLIKEGSKDDDVYFLLKGSLAVKSGDKLILRLNAPGDIAGEFAVVSSSPRSADVVTEVPSRLVRVSSSVVKQTDSNPELALQFITVFSHIMAAKLRETSSRAKLYEDAVLEAQEIATSHTKLESDIEDKLQEIMLYSKVIETSNDAVMIADTSGVIQRFNPAAERMFPQVGKKKGKVARQKFRDLVKDFDLGDYASLPPEAPWRGEWPKNGDQESFVLHSTVSPIPGRDGELVGVAYQLRDISLQKAQERAIARKNEEIQRALLDLESTYQELQRSDKLKTETLSVVSDELAAPVRRIINFAEKTAQDAEALANPAISENVRAIQEQTAYLKAISDNIGHLIDLQQNFQTVGMGAIDLKEVLQKIHFDLSPMGASRQITIALELPEEPISITGDAKQIQMVLNLLLEQALMVATPKTEVKMKAAVQDASQQISLEIVYEGPSFANLKPTKAMGQGRFGVLIGLPLARRVISQYQGSLRFMGDSKRGKVSVLLPQTQKEGQERPNRVFITDEQEMDRIILQGVIEHLWPNSVVFTTRDPFEFLDNYEDFHPDLVIVDPHYSTTGWSNHRVVASLVQNRRHVCPILSISALYNDFAERTVAVERGVTDFLAKPYSIFDIRFKIRSLVLSFRKEESLHKTMDQAQKQAFTDGLTKLANRKHFDGFLETQLNYSRQTHKPCSIIMLDIDNFKHYNDTHGHQMGDEVLRGVARVLATSVRASDLAARYGGEEFVIVLPETKKDMAAVIAEKMRRAIQETPLPNAKQQPLGFLSASFGVATFGEDGENEEDLIKAADDCLYLAKDRGRNLVIKAPGRASAK